MVDRTSGQLYTIEGIAAALIMLVTIWIVLGTTSIYTRGDTHINDMQLEQLGTDTLAMMDIPVNSSTDGKSQLETFIENQDGKGTLNFDKTFMTYCNNRTDGTTDTIQYTASVYYRLDDGSNSTPSYLFNRSRPMVVGVHPVRVAHWVMVNNTYGVTNAPSDVLEHRAQTVLLEVFLWRD